MNVGITTIPQILTSPFTLECRILNFPLVGCLLGSRLQPHPDDYGLDFPNDLMSLPGMSISFTD